MYGGNYGRSNNERQYIRQEKQATELQHERAVGVAIFTLFLPPSLYGTKTSDKSKSLPAFKLVLLAQLYSNTNRCSVHLLSMVAPSCVPHS